MKTLGNLIQLIIWWVDDAVAALPKILGSLIVLGAGIALVAIFPILLLFLLLGFGFWLVGK